MKISGKVIRVMLILMIIISLILSWKIWTNAGSTEHDQQRNPEKSLVTKQPKDVFLPVKLVYHSSEGGHYYTNKESLIQSMTKELVSRMKGKITISLGKKYLEPASKRGSFDMIMSSPISVTYFLKINGVEPDKDLKSSVDFHRLVVSLDESKLHFLDSDDRQVYQLKLSGEMNELKEMIKAESSRLLPVMNPSSELPVFYEFKNEIKLKKYSYILATQSYTTFSQAFFDDRQEVISNEENDDSKDVNLMTADGGTLTVLYDTGEVKYTGHFDETMSRSYETDTIFEDSFFYLKNIGTSMGTLRYFEGSDNNVTYRNYVEGYPIFSEYSKGRISVSKDNNNVKVLTNQETIQVPIPSHEEVVLKGTDDTIKELTTRGITKRDIQDLQIGYRWETNNETRQVVDLVPDWYVKLDGTWESLTEIAYSMDEKEGGK